jgi:hypothetical protein
MKDAGSPANEAPNGVSEGPSRLAGEILPPFCLAVEWIDNGLPGVNYFERRRSR